MRKFLKIVGITLVSLLTLILIGVGVLVYWVFTPERITPVVRELAGEFITCDYEIGQVDLTFFSTFPEFGLRADGLLVLNPTEGAQSDTLLAAKKVVARVDIMSLLEDGELAIHEVALQEAELNAFIAADGHTNYDVLRLPQDTTPDDSISEPFIRAIRLENLSISLDANTISLLDLRDSIDARFLNPHIALATDELLHPTKGQLTVSFPHLWTTYKGICYASDLSLSLRAPFLLDLRLSPDLVPKLLGLTLQDAQLSLNQLEVGVDGEAQLLPAIHTDLQLRTNKVRLSHLLQLVPAALFTMPEGVEADAILRLEAAVKGNYTDSIYPVVSGRLQVEDAAGSMQPLPYTFSSVEADAAFLLDLNKQTESYADIARLHAETELSNLTAAGRISDLLGAMGLDLQFDLNVNLLDAAYFLPDNIDATGKVRGQLTANIALDDLLNLALDKGHIRSQLHMQALSASYDSLSIQAPSAELALAIPNPQPSKAIATSHKPSNTATTAQPKRRMKRLPTDFVNATLRLPQGLTVNQSADLSAALTDAEIALQASNILSSDPVMVANVALQTSSLRASLSSTDSLGRVIPMDVDAAQPAIDTYIEYDARAQWPKLSCAFNMDHLVAHYDTISASLTSPSGRVSMADEAERLRATIDATSVVAQMGSLADIQTQHIALSAAAKYTDGKENILLSWQPRIRFDLNKAVAHVNGVQPELKIPACKLEYSNRNFAIDTARVELDRSSFSLAGNVQNIGPWLENKGMLTGDLRFASDYADIDELLALISSDGEEATAAEAAADNSAADAAASDKDLLAQANAATEAATAQSDFVFMVPKGVDLTLHTRINLASAFSQNLRELAGMVYIRDGIMVIEEMGFICDAANLQLTAIYKTPRRNHIFCGFDYHMTNINIEELVDMIPQVDTLLPMLRSFKGAANFHLAAETYLNDRYQLKTSTTRGAMSINAKDLTLLDGEVFSKIAKLLTFKKKTENKIDSISAEVALYKNELDIYPFVITCDKWMGAVGGRHNLDGTMDYHINLLAPIYLGVHVGGNLNTFEKLSDLDIKLAKCVYAKDFRPVFRGEVDTRAADIRKLIRQALEANLKTDNK